MISISFILFLLISILTSSYGQVTCPSGWVQNAGSCYWFKPAFSGGSIIGTWDQCNTYCTTFYQGATMLCVNNAAENTWIYSNYGSWYWIGYTDQYGWVTGCSSTYTNWASGQPDNMNNIQDYAVLSNASDWYDYGPQDSWYCGCEYTPVLTTTPSSRPTTAPSSYPSTVPSFRPTVAPSSGPTSSPTATPSFTSTEGSVSE